MSTNIQTQTHKCGPRKADIQKQSCPDDEPLTPQVLGTLGEYIARDHLQALQYHIECSNWVGNAGEVDIVAFDPKESEWVLTEVKTRLVPPNEGNIFPELAVHKDKQSRYLKLAREWHAKHPEEGVRFDVIGITVEAGQDKHSRFARLRHFVGAFEAEFHVNF